MADGGDPETKEKEERETFDTVNVLVIVYILARLPCVEGVFEDVLPLQSVFCLRRRAFLY